MRAALQENARFRYYTSLEMWKQTASRLYASKDELEIRAHLTVQSFRDTQAADAKYQKSDVWIRTLVFLLLGFFSESDFFWTSQSILDK